MMISSYRYLTPVQEAYRSMSESSKLVNELLAKVPKSIFKDDGYDQFGVDANGKKRNGEIALWRYPDRWFGDEKKLLQMLNTAKRNEDRFLGQAKHNYDRYGYDVLGFDRQGFNSDDKDILGHDGSEYGTKEYDAMAAEREHARHNLHSKNGMRQINYIRKNGEVSQDLEHRIVRAYKNASLKPNPQKEFENALKLIFLRQLPSGKLAFDKQSINYFLRKYPFKNVPSEKLNFSMNKRDYANQILEKLNTNLGRVFRPLNADDCVSVETVEEEEHGIMPYKVVAKIHLKDSFLVTATNNVARKKMLECLSIVANRLKRDNNTSAASIESFPLKNGIAIAISVFDEEHKDLTNATLGRNAEDDYNAKYGIGVYDPFLSSKLKERDRRRLK